MQYAPGQSGNPAGRPRGSRNKRTLALEKLMDENAEKILMTVLEKANKGDRMMLRVCMDRIMARAKQNPTAFELPPVANASEALAAFGTILQGVGDGEIAAVDAAELAMVVRLMSQVATDSNIEERVKKLESAAAQNAKPK